MATMNIPVHVELSSTGKEKLATFASRMIKPAYRDLVESKVMDQVTEQFDSQGFNVQLPRSFFYKQAVAITLTRHDFEVKLLWEL